MSNPSYLVRSLEVIIGTGGWDYYPTEVGDRLKAYAKRFKFVEVNSTFYKMPKLGTVRSWRRRVPRDFLFSVKCNSAATHVYRLEPVKETFQVLERMFMVCRLLLSQMLILQTPASLKVDMGKVKNISTMLKNLNSDEVQVFWEARTPWPEKVDRRVKKAMIESGIMPVVDISQENPIPGLPIIYSRLFSHGDLWYSDDLIKKIDERVSESGSGKGVLTFHGASMYRDASRYLELRAQ